jgi:hypothetical protein
VPWSELTVGSPYAVPGEPPAVFFRRLDHASALFAEYPSIGRALSNRLVLLLERDGPDDRLVDLMDDDENPPPF